jgi:hypothetical protein
MGERRYRTMRLRYYCQGQGNTEITKLLADIEARQDIPHEVLDLSRSGARDEGREKQVYETDFKPRAKMLKKRTGRAITQLRSRRVRRYYVSIPGTMGVIRDTKVQWYVAGDGDIIEFLKTVLLKGHAFLEERCQ